MHVLACVLMCACVASGRSAKREMMLAKPGERNDVCVCLTERERKCVCVCLTERERKCVRVCV